MLSSCSPDYRPSTRETWGNAGAWEDRKKNYKTMEAALAAAASSIAGGEGQADPSATAAPCRTKIFRFLPQSIRLIAPIGMVHPRLMVPSMITYCNSFFF
ncbi:hypothetical protein BRADI_1g58101v3 [Brachypodium distachyon]|uniref:Uncharacterized protein n=1 Tax=Brachypodium distachyon TaxID=15368 RepID=A0A2K2DS66_BRADI|nr:hypothetical protein BRADI_1g58101v3 [Brachypodium distachyon]